MSRVWAARLRGTRGFQKVVALKTLLATGSEGHTLEQMLLDEARHAAAIQHANVAQYLDVGEQDGVLFLVMEWLDGESLSRLIKNARKTSGIPLGVAVEIVVQACRGLHAAHELKDEQGQALGLVHCDVSPQNIMLTSAGTAKIIDFGVARATRGSAAGGSTVTGKLSFMAPEQIRGRDFDRRADLFSLGIVLYLLSTGQHPFNAKTPREIMNLIRVGAGLRPPSELIPNFPPELEQVILRSLAHSPADRFATAAEFSTALVRAVPERAQEHELAAFVEQVCKEELDSKRREILRALAVAPAEVEQGLLAAPPSSRRLPPSEASPPLTSTLPATVVTAPFPMTEPRSSKRRVVIASVLGIVALGGFGLSRLHGVRAAFSHDDHQKLSTLSAKASPAPKLAAQPVQSATSPLPSSASAEATHPLPPIQETPARGAQKSRGAAVKGQLPRTRVKAPAAAGKESALPKESKVLDRYGI